MDHNNIQTLVLTTLTVKDLRFLFREEIESFFIRNPLSKANALEHEKPLTVEEAADFLQLKIPTLYKLTARKELSFMKKGKKLYFYESQLRDYLQTGKNKTFKEVELEADARLSLIGQKKLLTKVSNFIDKIHIL